ncbi:MULTISPECIES: siroheme decarboxylase subunit beta [Cupriavidus]|uniref:siroheme decarboxylase n=1 Tax=Cupriavidus pauculus TaxID=82633 RepID=A0A3G8H967_9BURK|nr:MULTISPECIES: Lrp/AsnC family transcriptional regulator [Cupriavidus]AZG17033.1 Lrp/AsnC family transcriptional regulator [Cupriavidus pauculus]MDT6963063.1 Lrp/AsnC family transcriptional regulator [Cupriavidus sp. SZY C1]
MPVADLDEFALYNRIQDHFPLDARPYQSAGEPFNLSEHTLLSLLARDLGNGRISRIGAVFAPNTIGATTVAALSIPQARMEHAVDRINLDPDISQSHAREGHRYNLWFVAGARDRGTLDGVLARIAADLGQRPVDLPLEREYRADLGLPLGAGRGGRRVPAQPPLILSPPEPPILDEADWRLAAALEAGLALTPHPYHALTRRAGLPLSDTLARLARWRSAGVIRRFGAILRHRPFGYTHNVMCVWNVPDARVDAVGMRLAHVPHVSMCFRRARRLPLWQYNLFAMIHARSASELNATLARFDAVGGLADAPRAVLRASHCFKQRGTRYGGALPEF